MINLYLITSLIALEVDTFPISSLYHKPFDFKGSLAFKSLIAFLPNNKIKIKIKNIQQYKLLNCFIVIKIINYLLFFHFHHSLLYRTLLLI